MPPSFGGRAQGMVTTPEEQVLDDAERDPFEEALLIDLEELAQKADVLTKWADEMFEYVKAIPQSKSGIALASTVFQLNPFSRAPPPSNEIYEARQRVGTQRRASTKSRR
jgi:hypothetical protein